MKRIVYRELASCIDAWSHCDAEWRVKHWERIESLVARFMPSGSGIDSGTSFNFDRSNGERLVLFCEFHHMNEVGYYDGWTQHTVTVRPSLIHGFTLAIGGRNRNDIKEYLSQTFRDALSTEFDE